MGDRNITFVDENGRVTECEVLFTFHSDEFNKDYVLFYKKEDANNPNIQVLAAEIAESKDCEGTLLDIKTDEEWDLIKEVLDEYVQCAQSEDN